MDREAIKMAVTIDASKVMDIAKELNSVLKTANSLADELAEKLKQLELKIEI